MDKHRRLAPQLSTALALAAVAVAISGCANLGLGQRGQGALGGYPPRAKVAVLLPGAGPFAEAADAIRAGVRAAQKVDNTGSPAQLIFVDAAEPKGVAEGLAKAVGGGATQAIGPLEKPAVESLAKGPALKVPTLALNAADFAGTPAANLYQFALTPESEGVDIADKALAQGLRRALVLYSGDSGGTRRADAFRSRWRSGGGTLVGESTLGTKPKDAIKAAAALLSKGKADFVFLAADPEAAEQVYPALRQAAPALPVVATPSVYPGDASPSQNRALAGLLFVDMPWMIGAGPPGDPLRRSQIDSGVHYLRNPLGRRLFAMGIDAYRLGPRLAELRGHRGESFAGETGRLSIDSRGIVKRELILARFTDSGPVPAQTIAVQAVSAAKSRPNAGRAKAAATTSTPAAHRPRPEPAR
jgi:outer membrane PBP1 activator LpoA protein